MTEPWRQAHISFHRGHAEITIRINEPRKYCISEGLISPELQPFHRVMKDVVMRNAGARKRTSRGFIHLLPRIRMKAPVLQRDSTNCLNCALEHAQLALLHDGA